jgi:predicted HTH domain antitoxin
MSITISDDILDSSGAHGKRAQARTRYCAFQLERLTLRQAAKLADQTQLEFQKALASRHIPIHYGPKELDEDLHAVRQHTGCEDKT